MNIGGQELLIGLVTLIALAALVYGVVYVAVRAARKGSRS